MKQKDLLICLRQLPEFWVEYMALLVYCYYSELYNNERLKNIEGVDMTKIQVIVVLVAISL